MKLTGKEAMEKLQEKLSFDTETGMFLLSASDIVICPPTKTPHSGEEHGEEGENATVGCKS